MLAFGAGVVIVASSLPKTIVGRHVARQLVASRTSCGAHYAEAQFAESRRDFIHKILVAAKEVRETVYWLELSAHAGLTRSPQLRALLDEGEQLARIFGASARTARDNERRT